MVASPERAWRRRPLRETNRRRDEMNGGGAFGRELSRKAFVKGVGAMVVGVGVAGAGTARAAESPFASNGPYDPAQVDTWLTIHPDNTVSIKTGRTELGQGTSVGMSMIAAEEL